MTTRESINTHINKVLGIGNLLKDPGKPLPEDMLITKIMCSVPASYNSIVAAWANVPEEHKTIAKLKVRLLQLENLLMKQSGEPAGDSAFVTRSSKASSHNTKKHTHENSKVYMKELKSRTQCYNCGEFDHWTAECPHPRQDKTKFSNNKQAHAITSTQRDIEVKHALQQSNNQTHVQATLLILISEPDICAFMVINRQSHAFSVNLDKQSWFADSGATEHMTEHQEWFSTFKPIPSGT